MAIIGIQGLRGGTGATLAIRFISQRSVNEDYIRTAASQRVAALNDILRPLSAQRATLRITAARRKDPIS